jgi:hypothetical protein
MVNRLDVGLDDWRNNRSSGSISSSGSSRLSTPKISSRLDSDLDEWKKKRKIQAEQESARIAEEERLKAEQTTPPVAKPVDQMEYEKKSWEDRTLFEKTKSVIKEIPNTILKVAEPASKKYNDFWTKNSLAFNERYREPDPTGQGAWKNPTLEKYNDPNTSEEEKDLIRKQVAENDIQDDPILQKLNTETGKKITTFIVDKTSNLGIKEQAFKEAINPFSDRTYKEAYDEMITKRNDPNNNMFQRVAFGLQDSGFQSLIGTALYVIPYVGKPLANAYYAAISAGSQIKEKGRAESTTDIMIDTAGDNLLSGVAESLLKSVSKVGAKGLWGGIQNFSKGFKVEGSTEVLQTLGKLGNAYMNSPTDEDRAKVIQDTKEYITKGGMVEELAVAGISGGGITSLAGALNNQQTNPNIIEVKGETPIEEEEPLPKEEAPVTVPVENQDKITGFLDTISKGDTATIEETASTLSSEELNQVVSVLDRASEQGTPAQKAVIAEHKSLVQGLAENKNKKITGTIGRDIMEDSKTFNDLNETERSEAVKIIDKMSEAEHETAPKAKAMRETINSNNSIIKEAIERTGEMKEELLKKKKVAETPQEKKEIQTQIDELDDQKFAFKRAENKTDISDVIETMSPELVKSMKNLTQTENGRIITNNKQSYERTNNNLGRTNNAGGNAGSLSVGKNKPTGVGVGSQANGSKEGRVGSNNVSDNGKRVSDRQQLTKEHTEQQLSDEDMLSGEKTSQTQQLKPITVAGKEKIKTSTEKAVYGREAVRFMKGKYENTPFTTNGIIFELSDIGENEAEKADELSLERVKEFIEEAKANKYELSAPFGYVNGQIGVDLVFKAGKKNVVIQGRYYNYLSKKYKNLRLIANNPNDPVAIYNGDNFEGVIMPLAEDEDMPIINFPKKEQNISKIEGFGEIDFDNATFKPEKGVEKDSQFKAMSLDLVNDILELKNKTEKEFDKAIKGLSQRFQIEIYKIYENKYGEYPIGFINLSDNPFEWQHEEAGSIVWEVAQAETDPVETLVSPNLDDIIETLHNLKSRGKSSKIIQSDIQYDVEGTRPNTETKKYTKAEIEELAMSKDEFTEAEKNILRQYEGSGGQKDGEGRGVLDEYYTPKPIIDKIWKLVEQNIDGNIDSVIEPSVGTGRFLEGAPKDATKSGFETNPISAKIAKVLTGANIVNMPFEDMFIDPKGKKKDYPAGLISVVVGNPPYGSHRGKYKGLGEEPNIGRYEDYFIKRSLDLVRNGGIVAMVVPSGFLRGKIDYAKREIAKLGELVDAYRLPNGSFGTTDVGTDIVIFKKGLSSDTNMMRELTLNSNDEFFTQNPDKVLGAEGERKGRFGMEKHVEGTLEEAMEKLTIDEVVAEQQAVEEFEDEDKEAVEMEQPFTPEIEKEAVKKTRIAKVKKTRAQVAKKDVLVKGVLKRNEEEPHIVEGIKKGAVKTFTQGEKLSEQDQKFLQLTEEDGSINGMSLSETEKETLNQYEGNFYTDFNYYQGDIYDKLQVLEQEHNAGRIEDEQYERQKAGLEAIKPEAMPINKITLLPIDRLAKDIKRANGKSLIDGFANWLETLPYDALEGSSRWEIAGYLNGQPVRGGSVEQNVKESTRRRRMGNKLFKKYYNEELEANDQQTIADNFNKTFNSYVKPDYSEYPLDVELFGKFYGKDFEMRDIQMEGAAFLVNKGVGLLAYEVGVGKTLAGIAAISNVMKKGWAKRPLIIVPKNLKSKWISDLAESMPNVKINDLSNLGGNFKYKGKPEDLRIADGTISVITEDGFKRIGFQDDTYSRLTANLEDVLYEDKKKSKRSKEIDKAKTEEIIGKATRKTDFPLTFEQLGFDHITIDEAHRSKNIFSKAKAKGEKGKSANEYGAIHGAMSERGLKTYLATQYILEQNNGRNVFLLTATPFSNSPIEIYSMLSLMAKKRLEGLGIKNINDFISMFCEIETRYAIKANGSVQLSDQVRKFTNLQQLQKLVREYIDFRTGEEAGVPRPTKRKITPHLKMNAMQAEYVEKAQELFSPKYKQEGGTLLAISELQKITFSPYLSRYFTGSVSNVSPKDIVENSPKIKYAVEAIKKAHEVNPNVGQIIFSEKGVELFRPIRDYFIKELKYKANEVEIIDSSCSDAVKDDIQDRFQNGEVKILLASGTVKEGVDLQKNSTDLYNLYLQWNPTDMIQAEGRTWRQGSYYDNVRIHYPLIQNSIDPFIFQKLEEKASRISNVFSYKGDSLDVSDIDFENMKFELITDPVMRVEAKYQYDKAEIDNKFTVAEAEIAFMERRTGKIAELKSDIESYTERKKEAIAQDDESDVAYYSDKLTKRKAELKEEQDKLDKKGIKVEEVNKEIEAKKAELETIKAEREKLSEQLQVDLEEAREQKYQVISGTNDFNNMLDFMGNKEFFTHDGKEYIGRLPASFKKGAIHDNVADKDAYARLMMVRTPYAEFEKTTKKLLKQHGLKMNVEMFHSIMDTMTNEKVMGITWGDTIGAVEFVTAFTAHHEVLHAVEDALIRSKIISRQMGYEIKQLPEFARFDIDTLNELTAKQVGGNSENMSEMREKRAELFEQYVDRKQQLSLPQKLKEYFAYVFKQFLRVHGFLKQVGMMSFFDQLYYGKSKGEQTIIDQNFIKRMTRYEMDEKGKMKKTLNLSELEIAMEFGGNLPSYKAEQEAQEAPQKPLVKDGHISVSELYRRVYNEFYEGKVPAMNSLEDEKLTRGMTKRAFTLGKRYSTKTTKENYKQVQKDVRNYIVKNIPPKHRGELLRAVINAKSKADVDIVIDKVNEMVEKGKGREIASQKKDLMKLVYEIFLARGMTEKSTGRVNGAMLRQAVQHVAKNDGRVKMRQLTVPELEELKTIAQTLKQDKLGRIILINEIKREKLNDLLPEELQGKEFVTMGDIENSIVNSDISSGMFGLFNKNLLRAGRLAMIKNELTKKMYDKFTTADRNTANQAEAFDKKIAEMYKKATGKLTSFRDKETDQKVIDYLEGRTNGETLNENEMALANEIVQFYADSIEVMKPNRLRKYYFTHTRQNFLESVQSVGFKQTVSEFFNQEFMQDFYSDLPPEIAANLEYIVANRVFNPFGLPRKGKRFSQDLRKALQTYSRVYFTKKNFDKLYAQSNAVLTILPPNMQAFFRRYLQSSKGRPEGRAFNPAIKRVVEIATTWEYIKLLGGNLASGFFNIAVGLVDNYAAMGIITKDSLVIGHGRYITPKGYQMINKYRVTGQNITYEMTQLMHTIPEIGNKILFFQLGIGEHYLRGTAFLSLLTHEEFKAGEVSDKRMSEIRHRIGEAQPLYGKFDSPVYGRHVIGKTFYMFLTWLPTRIENWVNWVKGAGSALKNEKSIMDKTINNKDLGKVIRFISAFILMSLMFGDRDRWKREVDQYKYLFSIGYWVNLMNPTTKPVWKDVINIGLMFKYLANQEEYTKDGTDYESGDMKWQIYLKRLIEPTAVKRIEQGKNVLLEGWLPSEEETVNKYQYYNSQN